MRNTVRRARSPLVWLLVALAAIIVFTLAAAGPVSTADEPQKSTAADVIEITVVAREMSFEPRTITVPAGSTVAVNLENKGVVAHDFDIAALGFNLHAVARQTSRGELTVEAPGEYEIICSIPGHKEAGMVGKLIVEANGSVGKSAAAVAIPVAAPQSPTTRSAITTARLPQPQMAPPLPSRGPTVVAVEIEAKEVIAAIDEGVSYEFWTFGGTVPGPMIRVRQGDTVELTFKNAPDSKATHSIDLHSVTGPGGGARATQVAPGKQAIFRFQALNPGVYVYHCATPMVAHHIASGMYGLIVVEPEGRLPQVDREFYVMQGDFYLQGERGLKGHRGFSVDKMLDERPDYVLFNGSARALTEANALKARVGETVRIFFGVGGPNLTSSFHVIGEIFDRVYPEGASEALTNVQTTLVPAGGATIVDFALQYPGSYVLVDHSLGRLEKGGAGQLVVEGPENPATFQVISAGGDPAASGH